VETYPSEADKLTDDYLDIVNEVRHFAFPSNRDSQCNKDSVPLFRKPIHRLKRIYKPMALFSKRVRLASRYVTKCSRRILIPMAMSMIPPTAFILFPKKFPITLPKRKPAYERENVTMPITTIGARISVCRKAKLKPTINSYKERDHKPTIQSWVASLTALVRTKKKKWGSLIYCNLWTR
jgi:hypothetical protein